MPAPIQHNRVTARWSEKYQEYIYRVSIFGVDRVLTFSEEGLRELTANIEVALRYYSDPDD